MQTSMNNNTSDSILEILSENLMNERLDAILSDRVDNITAQDNIKKASEAIEFMKLPIAQSMAIDTLISAYNAYWAYYARMAYQQGMKDCVALMREIGAL